MTQFLNKSFSVSLSSPDYAKGWERAFGKKKRKKPAEKPKDEWGAATFRIRYGVEPLLVMPKKPRKKPKK